MTAVLLVLALLTPVALATPAQAAVAVTATSTGRVLINELSNGASRSDSDTFFELRNWDDHAIDLTGWEVYRCSVAGLRRNAGTTEGDLTGVVLQPGEIVTVSRVGTAGDLHVTSAYTTTGFGLYLENPANERADAVAVYPTEPWPTDSDCSTGRNLPNTLNFALDESWQRVADTGDPRADFIAAPSTPTAPNATSAAPVDRSGVMITEFANGGPAGSSDEFVELRNLGGGTVDISGWQLYRCTSTGRLRPAGLEATVPSGTRLAHGDYWVFTADGFAGEADARYSTPFADVSSGAYLQSDTGQLVDRIAVSTYGDSACQSGDEKLPAVLDYVAGESYQFTSKGFIVAPRTPGADNETTESSVFRASFAYPQQPGVAISEVATDPGTLPDGTQRNFIELANYGQQSVDISGWSIRRCEANGIRSRTPQVTVATGTILAPGATFVAAREGTATEADAHYSTTLNFLGTGVWVANARGERVDSLGIYGKNEMDDSLLTPSPCTKGVPLATFLPDRVLHESYQRAGFTGVDLEDFHAGHETPGVLDDLRGTDLTARVHGLVDEVPPAPAAVIAELPSGSTEATVTDSWFGSTAGPLSTLVGVGEVRDPAERAADPWGSPYQRLVLDASTLESGSRIVWQGSSTGRNELQLSVWSPATGSWRLLDAGSGSDENPAIQLSGAIIPGEIEAGTVTVLVQDGPRTAPTLAAAANGALESPADYDFAISHITDTQYLSESYPEVYAQLVSWIADNAEQRKIEFATHTGDLVQNWVDPNQEDSRARIEYERASAVQAILDEAGVPNSVLPGNHDNKRGIDNSLFNEYFGPDRYAESDWYAGSIGPLDNSANFSTFEHEGAAFLMLSLPYAYGEEELAWAESVVTSHPDFNIVISTHEHVTPLTDEASAHRSTSSRWVSRGQQLWDRVIAPNRNVVVVLSGHFHGIGSITTENAGGIEGHDVVELLADYQEFRTHSGERATGFQRLLQIDLDGSAVAVDTFSVRLDAKSSYEYDYPQFVTDNGIATTASNARPWNVVALGLQDRYTAADDEFGVTVHFQYPKAVVTRGLLIAPPELLPAPADPLTTARPDRDAWSLNRSDRA